MLRFSKYATSLLVVLVTTFWFLATYSTIETRYECKGELKLKGKTQPQILYIKLEEYRWWIVWADSDASLMVEYPNEWIENYRHVKQVGDQLQIFDSKKSFAGHFSTLSKTLRLTDFGDFSGICTKIEK